MKKEGFPRRGALVASFLAFATTCDAFSTNFRVSIIPPSRCRDFHFSRISTEALRPQLRANALLAFFGSSGNEDPPSSSSPQSFSNWNPSSPEPEMGGSGPQEETGMQSEGTEDESFSDKDLKRIAKVSQGLQERTAAQLKVAEAKRLAENAVEEQKEELRREVDDEVQRKKASIPRSEQNALWEAQSSARIEDAVQAARRKGAEMKLLYEEREEADRTRRADQDARALADGAAAALLKAEELRREYEAEHAESLQPQDREFGEVPRIKDDEQSRNTPSQSFISQPGGVSSNEDFSQDPTEERIDPFETERRRRERAKASFRARNEEQELTIGMDEFKNLQEAAIRAEEETRMQADRRYAEEAKLQEQASNRLRQKAQTKRGRGLSEARVAADKRHQLENEDSREAAIRAAVEQAERKAEEEARKREDIALRRKAETEARLERLAAARKRSEEEEAQRSAAAEAKRRKVKEQREAAIASAKRKKEEEEVKKRRLAETKKYEEEERSRNARMKVEGMRLQAEADRNRQEIKDFIQNRRSEADARRLEERGRNVQESERLRAEEDARLRVEEARLWAQAEARRKYGGAYAPHRLFEDEETTRVRNVYQKWADFYGKPYDVQRFDTFRRNLVEIERYYSSAGGPVQLNEFADLTAEEYRFREQDPVRWESEERRRAREQRLLWEAEERTRAENLAPWDEGHQREAVVARHETPGSEGLDNAAGTSLGDEPWRRDPDDLPQPQQRSTSGYSDGTIDADVLESARRRDSSEAHSGTGLEANNQDFKTEPLRARPDHFNEERNAVVGMDSSGQPIVEKRHEEKGAEQLSPEVLAKIRGEEVAKRQAEEEKQRDMQEKKLRREQNARLNAARERGELEARRLAQLEDSRKDEESRARNSLSKKQVTTKPDGLNTAILRGQAQERRRSESKTHQKDFDLLREEKKSNTLAAAKERARLQAERQEEAAKNRKLQEEEAQKRLTEEATRRAYEEDTRRKEAQAKRKKDETVASEIKRQAFDVARGKWEAETRKGAREFSKQENESNRATPGQNAVHLEGQIQGRQEATQQEREEIERIKFAEAQQELDLAEKSKQKEEYTVTKENYGSKRDTLNLPSPLRADQDRLPWRDRLSMPAVSGSSIGKKESERDVDGDTNIAASEKGRISQGFQDSVAKGAAIPSSSLSGSYMDMIDSTLQSSSERSPADISPFASYMDSIERPSRFRNSGGGTPLVSKPEVVQLSNSAHKNEDGFFGEQGKERSPKTTTFDDSANETSSSLLGGGKHYSLPTESEPQNKRMDAADIRSNTEFSTVPASFSPRDQGTLPEATTAPGRPKSYMPFRDPKKKFNEERAVSRMEERAVPRTSSPTPEAYSNTTDRSQTTPSGAQISDQFVPEKLENEAVVETRAQEFENKATAESTVREKRSQASDSVALDTASHKGKIANTFGDGPTGPNSSQLPSSTSNIEKRSKSENFISRILGRKTPVDETDVRQPGKTDTKESSTLGNQSGVGLPFFLSNINAPPPSAQVPPESDFGGDDLPLISAWAQTPEGSIHGFISNSLNFEEGAYIITTPVQKGAKGGSIVTTESGSQYRLSVQPKGGTSTPGDNATG